MRLEGRRVLVLGASSGLGRASALEIAREGGRVCVAARRADRLAEAVDEAGNGAFAVACDVRDEASCRSAVEAAVAELGGLDALVYAPGISTFGPVEEISAQEWHDVFATNVFGFSLVLNAAIEPLTAARGRVVAISSITIDDSPPRPFQATYPVSKLALERLIEAWQGEHHAVGFTSIASGDTLSEFGHGNDMERMVPIVQQWQQQGYLYGRMMDASSIGEQVVNAIAARETLRRIAITPAYPEAVGDGNVAETGRAAIELNREKGAG
ncbi:MAG: SDR family oxidoreductase [Myxococcota bacterium]